MAAFAIFVSLWSLVLAQDHTACGSEDEASMVQVNVGQSRSMEATHQWDQRPKIVPDLVPDPKVVDQGKNCQEECGGSIGGPDACDVDKMLALTTGELSPIVGGCNKLEPVSGSPARNAAPFVTYSLFGLFKTCYYSAFKESFDVPKCSATVPGDYGGDSRRICQCKAPTFLPNQDSGGGSAENVGDPHIHSFRGAHYTLLQQGVFVAWNFSKAVPGAAPAEWQLLAAYTGERFTTQGLLLLDPHAGSMEITADDCIWRVKEENSLWRQASLGQISAEVGTTSLEVKKLHEKLGETKILKSSILLQMRSGSHGVKGIASLVTHCVPQNHLDFKLTMFNRKDLEYVGGELGVAPDANHNYNFFTKKSVVQMRADQEFKAPGSWVTLGGSPAGAAYLEKQHTAASLLQSHSCSDAEEDHARAVCSKHLDEATHPEMFSDCLFDLCHGGDESFAQSAAAFLMPLDNSP